MEFKLNFKALGMGQMTKVRKNLDKTNASFDKMTKKLEKNKKALKGIAGSETLSFFDNFNRKAIEVVSSSHRLNAVGGPLGLIKFKLTELNDVLKTLGGGTLLTNLKVVGLAFKAWLAPLAAVFAGIWAITRVWKENIGGIQTKWIAFMGKLRNSWSKFEVSFRKFLHSIEPVFDVIFTAGFALLNGIFEGFVSTLKVLVGIVTPFFKVISSIFGIFKTDGKASAVIWKSIGQVAGVVLGVFTGFIILQKIIMMVKALQAAFIAFNIIVAANPISLIVLGIAAVVALFVVLQKKFNIFGKAMAGIKAVFTWLINAVKKLFTFSITNSPLFKGIKLVMKAIQFLKRDDKTTDTENMAADRAAKAVSSASNVSNSIDNRKANVTIYTSGLDTRQAKQIGEQFVDPVMAANKQQ